jgi:hypothetical protein
MYLDKCGDNQIKELVKCYADFTEINILRNSDSVEVECIVDDIPEQYTLYDFSVDVYDWDDKNTDCLQNYRKKMLEFFGNQYAIDYLVNNC